MSASNGLNWGSRVSSGRNWGSSAKKWGSRTKHEHVEKRGSTALGCTSGQSLVPGMLSGWNWGWSMSGRRNVGFKCDEQIKRGVRVCCVSE